MSKSIFWSKTIWVNVIAIIAEVSLLVAQTFADNPEMTTTLWAGLVYSVSQVVLRYVTTKPVHVIPPK